MITKSKNSTLYYGKVTDIKAGTWPPSSPTIWIHVRATEEYSWRPNLGGIALKDSKLSIPERMVVINDPPQEIVDKFAQAGF